MLKIKQLFQLHLKKNINVLIFFIFSSFLLGNIFGLNSKFLLFQSPEIFLFFVPLLIEILNLLTYNFQQKFSNKIFLLVMTSIRRGFFLGIFIEAFKLGS